MIKKIVCLLLCLLLIFTVGCSSAQEDVGEETPQGGTASTLSGELQLLYCANDTMNPYKTISKLNAELGLLLYDSLVNSFPFVSSVPMFIRPILGLSIPRVLLIYILDI